MPRTPTRRFIYLLLLTASSLARAQASKLSDATEVLHVAPAPSDRFPAKWYTHMGDGTDELPAPIFDNPYTAIVETDTPYQSPSGESLQQVTRDFQARDRFGRTRSEALDGATRVGGQMVPTKAVIVFDPVSHCQFQWTELSTGAAITKEMRLALVTCGPQTLRYKDLNFFGSLLNTADGTITHGDTTTQPEQLAPLQIDGLTVHRVRVSNSRRDEHGQGRHWSAETWYSTDLKEVIRSGDEESGYTILTEIRRYDPDPKLFNPPDGYRIQLKSDH